MKKPEDAGERLRAIMLALADREDSASDQAVLTESAADGVNVPEEAARVRAVLMNGLLRAKKARLSRAREAHQRAVADLGTRRSHLPLDPAARRKLLTATVRRRPEMREAVMTLQHREFESFTDADVESALKQMDALGLLDDDPESAP